MCACHESAGMFVFMDKKAAASTVYGNAAGHTQVLRDLITAIRPAVSHPLLNGWKLRFLLRLDGKQQQQKVPAECKQATGALHLACMGV